MIVISMSDFLSNPTQYMETAKHTNVLVENAGIKLTATKNSVFSAVAKLFAPRKRKLGPLEGKMKLEWVGDGKITPEEMFDDDDEDFSIGTFGQKQG